VNRDARYPMIVFWLGFALSLSSGILAMISDTSSLNVPESALRLLFNVGATFALIGISWAIYRRLR